MVAENFLLPAVSCVVNAYVLYTAVHPEIEMSMPKFRKILFRGLVDNYSSRRRRSYTAG